MVPVRKAALGVATLSTTVTSARPAAACAARTTKTIKGTLVGADGKGLNAFIGFDLETGPNGHKVNIANGCPIVTYGARVRLNPTIPAKGAKVGGSVTKSFSISGIPANAKVLYAEVYLDKPDGTHAYSPYGWTVRQQITIGPSGVNLKLVAPLTSSTGQLKVVLNRPPSDVLAFSQLSSTGITSPGWGIGEPVPGSGGKVYLVKALAAGQPYVIVVGGGHLLVKVMIRKGKTTTVHETF